MRVVPVRLIERERPLGKLRIWTGGASPDGRRLPPEAVVGEWAGQSGHPSSYALLGVTPAAAGVTFVVPMGAARFRDSLAGSADDVVFGEPGERERQFIEEVLKRDASRGWGVLVAASGRAGSSPMAFRWLAKFLQGVVQLEVDDASAQSLWSRWDEARREGLD